MTRFEKIKQELTIELVADFMQNNDKQCFEMAEKKTGYKYKCPYETWSEELCRKCAVEWLSEEVKDDV